MAQAPESQDSSAGVRFGTALAERTEIPPQKLLPESQETNLEGSLLALAVFFNDVKGLLRFQAMREQERPSTGLSGPSGEWSGMVIQIRNLLCGAVRELFGLMEQNDDRLTRRSS